MSQEPGPKPEPEFEVPEQAPGGPDAVVHDDPMGDSAATPDQPQAAQVEDEEVPDEIKQPDETDEGERDVDPGQESQA